MSFRLKTIFGIAIIELAVMAILITVNQLNLGGSASAQLYQRVKGTGELFATMVADAAIATDLATLDSMIDNALSNKDMLYLRVRSPSGITMSEGGESNALSAPFVADTSFESALNDNRIDVSSPIMIGGQTFGSIEIGISTLPVEREMASALRWNLLVAVIGMTLVAIFGFLLGSVLTRQLTALQRGAQIIAGGDLGHQIPVRGRDELAQTGHCFNDMARSLLADRAALEEKQQSLLHNKARVETIVSRMTDISLGTAHVEVPDVERTDEIGDMARATVVFRDAMFQVQQARAEQERLISAFDQVDEQVAIFGTDGEVIFLNDAFRRGNFDVLLELEPPFTHRDFLEAGIAQDVYPDAVGREQEWLESRLDYDKESAVPVEIARVPGRTMLSRCSSVPGIGVVISASDVTDLRNSQAQLVQASKLATLGEMATGVAHELNQPLGVIRMAATNCIKRIGKGQLDAAYLTGKLQRMADQTERAAQIIDHMRIFGRKSDDHAKPFDLRAALLSSTSLMRTQLSMMNIDVREDIPDAEIWSMGHAVTLEQVVLNLMSNARDAIESHRESEAVTGEILVSVQEENGFHVVLVEDNGGGVPEDVMARMFDPFFTTKEVGKGTGLGLSISYGIIKEMGGCISVTNTEDGARFRIDVPKCEPGSNAAAA